MLIAQAQCELIIADRLSMPLRFDRMVIAQAQCEGFTTLTCDPRILRLQRYSRVVSLRGSSGDHSSGIGAETPGHSRKISASRVRNFSPRECASHTYEAS